MKKLENLGKTLKVLEQKSVNGGMHPPTTNFVCIENFPFIYYVNEGELCRDGSVPLCP
ncbi:hypothetical protein [uncultured Dokdonia sp.]|uniref:hypothetical protein n=1 Tax=uncultured Dokdonia sp. TaxID=575653 RepID=UPI00260EF008|nr:hypothetical protein [uncultured Dokdonia sp.]